jgi:hypothetical protein
MKVKMKDFIVYFNIFMGSYPCKTIPMRVFLLIVIISTSTWAAKLKSFETDYCTFFPEGTLRNPNLWKHCCIAHDLRYWVGGNQTEQNQSDLALKKCVNKVAGKVLAETMYLAIRTGHYSPIKSKYRWSWGWSPKRKFHEITSTDLKSILKLSKEIDLDAELVQAFIDEVSAGRD